MEKQKIRQPIVSVVGHVDHGKTSILDCFRGTCLQEGEAGGITQKISFTKFPLTQVKKICPLLGKNKVELEIPGFLFIDTPGHAAFTNLRKRGGSLADLAILVINIKEGIKPQTAEVLQILRQYKTPFLIALNKIDSISGWQKHNTPLKESIEIQQENVKTEFQTELLTFQGALSSHGFESDLFYEISDFSKKVALVPCSAKTKEGISELLFVLCGLSQKFLKERLKISNESKGVILEIKKEKIGDNIEAILYDGILKTNDEIGIATFNEPIITKIRALEEIEPLCDKYKTTNEVSAATGIRMHLTNKEGILAGMPFQKISKNDKSIGENLKKQLAVKLPLDNEGIVIKADSLGSLEALAYLLRQENIRIVRAGIGHINKSDIVAAKANLKINPLNAVIIGFNVCQEEDFVASGIKILQNDVIYKLIEELQKWLTEKKAGMERERLLSLSAICKLEILHKYVFRNSNPAVFGVRVIAGKLKTNLRLIDETGEEIARIKAIQHEKESIPASLEGTEVAISLPGVNFERKLADKKFLYSELSELQIKKLKQNKDLLSSNEMKVLQEILEISERIK